MDLCLPSFENCSRDHNLEAFMKKGRVYLDYRNNQWIFVSQASRIVYIPGFRFLSSASHGTACILSGPALPVQSRFPKGSCLLRTADRDGD
ncbi:hypothetical protein NC652_031748 [Populus alba x Populus x berolinensis]|nr:hypothetical protein NC652_031748 [Populus alba x Populus x berolinensis]